MKWILSWSALAGVAALTLLGFNAKPAMAWGGSQNQENRGNGSPGYSDQNSPRESMGRRPGRGAQERGNHRRNLDPSNEGRAYSGNGYGGSQGGQWGQRGNWNNRERGQQRHGGRWNRGDHGWRGHGRSGGDAGWRDQGNWGNRGGCGN